MLNLKNINPSLREFIEDVEELVSRKENEQTVTKKVAKRLQRWLREDGIIPKEYKQPNPNKYTLYPLYVAPNNSFSIASAVWDVGQSTPIHDHGTWGVIGIVQGTEHEIHYDMAPNAAPQKVREQNLQAGEVTVCCTSDQDIHEVSCASKEPCVGIHVYGGNIGELQRHVYDHETGRKNSVVTAWDPVPLK